MVPPNNINSETTASLIFAEDSLLNMAIKIGDLSKAVQTANNVLQAISKDPVLDKREKTKVKTNFAGLFCIGVTLNKPVQQTLLYDFVLRRREARAKRAERVACKGEKTSFSSLHRRAWPSLLAHPESTCCTG